MPTVRWQDLKASELRDLAARDAIVVVPCGSIEQHGPHLPVQVDARLATEVSVRAAAIAAERAPVVVAPTVWCGLAEHHMAFGGTITLDMATYHALLRCVCGSAVRHGFQRIVLLNGHGGNVAALGVIAGELARELDAAVITATYWHLAETAERFGEILEVQENVRHAGEAETSMMLAVAPELVDAAAARAHEPWEASIVAPSGAYRYRPFTELSPTGVIGAPATASAEKGERLLGAAAQALANVLLDEAMWR